MSETDLELLARYHQHHADDAFAELVRRHIDLVHSAALRQVRSPELAEEIAQATFLCLAQDGHRLTPDTVLGAWLYRVARRAAANVVRRETRRLRREQIATEMNNQTDAAADGDWTLVEPVLDDAMHRLKPVDQAAVVLRYFENRSLREVGQALGTSENAAQKRLSRALEQLRAFLAKRGITVGAAGLAVALSAHAVQAAPGGLSVTISTAAVFSSSTIATSTIAPGILLMTSTQKGAIAGAIALLLAFGGATAFFLHHHLPARHRAAPAAREHPDAKLEFRWVARDGDVSQPADVLPEANSARSARAAIERNEFRVLKEVVLDGRHVESAIFRDNQADGKELLLTLTADGGAKLSEATANNLGRQLAIVWNGQVLHAPRIRSAIRGRNLSVTGRFDDADADLLLSALNQR